MSQRLIRLGAPVGLGLLVLVYLASVLIRIGDNPIVGGDEGWIISAAAKLAQQGIFGSDLFRGFYGVEDVYFFNLPLHHIVVAGAFKLVGVGIVQARLVSVGYGLAALLLTYALGRRVGGSAVALGAAALLVFLRLNLAPFSGLTLTDLGATVRYDLIAVPYGLGAAWLLLRRPDAPSRLHTTAAGALLGLGAMTQFIGAFFAPPLALFLLTLPGLPLVQRLKLVSILAAGAVVVCLPYGVYTAAHWQEFRDQSRAFDQKTHFLSPGFYVDMLRDEPDRYALGADLQHRPSSLSDLASRPSTRLVMLIAGPLALVFVSGRARRSIEHRLLAFVLIGMLLELALFESTKRYVYWVGVVPFLCIALADVARWVFALRPSGVASLSRIAVVAVAALFLLEGGAVLAKHVINAPDAPSYAETGRRIDAALPPGASAMGDNRLWPALRDRDFRSLLLLFYHTNPRISPDAVTDVPGAMDRIGADYLLLTPLGRDILRNLSPTDAAAFQRYLDERATLETTVEAPGYGPVEVYRLRH